MSAAEVFAQGPATGFDDFLEAANAAARALAENQSAVNPGGLGFVVLHWRMEPRTRILPHAHTFGNVVTVGLEGLVRVRNYEVVGNPDFTTDSDFVVRNTIDQALTVGATNLVSLRRVDAGPEGGRGLDITTRILPKPDFGVPISSLGSRSMRTAPGGAREWRHAAATTAGKYPHRMNKAWAP